MTAPLPHTLRTSSRAGQPRPVALPLPAGATTPLLCERPRGAGTDAAFEAPQRPDTAATTRAASTSPSWATSLLVTCARRLALPGAFFLLAGAAHAGVLDWTPDPDDNPCELITEPDDAADPGWLMWRAALCGDGVAAMLPPVRRLGGLTVASDGDAYALLRDAWDTGHRLPAPIPLPAGVWLLLGALAMLWRVGR